MIDYLGWVATAVFVGSYFCAAPEMLKGVQMLGALMWVAYGIFIGASPVVAANLLVFGAAAWTMGRQRPAQSPSSRLEVGLSYGVCEADPTMRSAHASTFRLALLASAILSVLTVSAQQPPSEGQRGRGRGGDPFAGQPRVNALVISGGCCHDYALQSKLLVDSVSRVLPVDWTVAIQGGRGTTGRQPLVENPDWARGYDIVVHNQCFADTTDEALIKRITSAHRGGPPAIVIHCAMHTYRASTNDTWREFLGVTTRRHTKAHNISVKVAAKDHAIMKGFKEDWVTPVDELYVLDKFWPNSVALASAVSPEDQKEYPLAWTSDYGGTRIFGTTLGHGNDTWNDPVFQDLLGRAFKWTLKRE